jgi:hypothetical protein
VPTLPETAEQDGDQEDDNCGKITMDIAAAIKVSKVTP